MGLSRLLWPFGLNGPILTPFWVGRPLWSQLVFLCPTSLSSYISGSFLLPLCGSHVTFSPCSFSAIFGYPFLGSSSVLAEQRFSLSRICFPELQEKSRATGNSHAIDFSMAALHNILNTSPVCKLVCFAGFPRFGTSGVRSYQPQAHLRPGGAILTLPPSAV